MSGINELEGWKWKNNSVTIQIESRGKGLSEGKTTVVLSEKIRYGKRKSRRVSATFEKDLAEEKPKRLLFDKEKSFQCHHRKQILLDSGMKYMLEIMEFEDDSNS